MPRINEILFILEDFQYDMSLDLKIVYYHIGLGKTQVTFVQLLYLRGEYRYKHLPMVIGISPDISQHKMNGTYHGFYSPYVHKLDRSSKENIIHYRCTERKGT